jgi:hypothetical protein
MPELSVESIFQTLTNASEDPVTRHLLYTQTEDTAFVWAWIFAVRFHCNLTFLQKSRTPLSSALKKALSSRKRTQVTRPLCPGNVCEIPRSCSSDVSQREMKEEDPKATSEEGEASAAWQYRLVAAEM